jgi:hypothetical protein
MLQQHFEDLKGLVLKPNFQTVLVEFSCLEVQVKDSETYRVGERGGLLHRPVLGLRH